MKKWSIFLDIKEMQIIPTMLTSHPSENSNHQEDNTGRVEDKEEPFSLHT